jgi:hypothetical protein
MFFSWPAPFAALGQVMFKVGATGRDTLPGFVNV